MMPGIVHIVGAGLAGLAAGVALAREGADVRLIEASPQGGGRCRSYFDPTLGRVIDNGNHLVLSGNWAVRRFLETIGAQNALQGPECAVFAFADLKTGERWTVRPNEGSIPWWIFSKKRRVPGTRLAEYAAIVKLIYTRRGGALRSISSCGGTLWRRLLHPVLLAGLNTDPETASVKLAATLLRETLGKGGRACRPRTVHPTLAAGFVDPAIAYLEAHGAKVRFGRRVMAVGSDELRVTELVLPDEKIAVGEKDIVILAVPPWAVKSLLPSIAAPDAFRSIVNGHFAHPPPAGVPAIMGVVGGTAEWIFAFPERISVTVSNADRLNDCDRAELAQIFWRDIQSAYGIGDALPPWQIVKEKRATFAATDEQEAKRPGTSTQWKNLFLAGDWIDTGLPATLEGAIRSGYRAAELTLKQPASLART